MGLIMVCAEGPRTLVAEHQISEAVRRGFGSKGRKFSITVGESRRNLEAEKFHRTHTTNPAESRKSY